MPRGLRSLTTPKKGADSIVDAHAKTASGFHGEDRIFIQIEGIRYDAFIDDSGEVVADTPRGRYSVVWS